MRRQLAGYQVIPFPAYQRLAAVIYHSVRHKPMIHGLAEVDVTRARTALREYKARTGESLSFTAFLATCLARAVAEHRAVQAFHLGTRHLVLFEDVDVAIRVEHDVAGHKYVVPHIIRAANRKTVRAIHDEIRAAQRADVHDDLTRFRLFPAWLFRVFVAAVSGIGLWRPPLWKELMGTVGLTSVGMFGHGAGWGIPASSPTALMVTVGGIGEKPVIADGQVTTHEYLSLTISVDHNLVDGAPAARFAQRLKELIERGYGLDDLTANPAPAEKVPQLQTAQ